MNSYICPVCGYDKLTDPPSDHNICPSCGTEFEYDDVGHSVEQLRAAWIARGAPWFSEHTAPPTNWDPMEQVKRLTEVEPISFICISQNVTAESHQYSDISVTLLNFPTPIVQNRRLEREQADTEISSIRVLR